MRAAFLTFFGIALLGLPQPAHARGGGDSSGGSSSDRSGGDGSSGTGFDFFSPSGDDRSSDCYNVTAGRIGNTTDPFNDIYTNQWLYKFVGSYYNGSVEVEATIDAKDVSCEEQRPVFKEKLDAVLMVGEQLTDLREPNPSPYMFSIVGWKEGTQPGGMPDFETKWVSPDARLMYDSIENARGRSTGTMIPKDADWTVTNQKSGNGYSFEAIFTETADQFVRDSFTILSLNSCNGSQPVDFLMEAIDKPDFLSKDPEGFAQRRTRANGTFDGTSATLSIGGQFDGKFRNWYTRLSDVPSKSKYGTYKLKFSGNLDRSHSHALSTSGQTPSWTKNQDLLPGGSEAVSAAASVASASAACMEGDSAGSRVEVGKAILGLAVLGGLVAAGMGIVLW
ncbi:hypothetical protein B9Z19DRAFT_1118532 [Tuber borchii]|uniref:Concanavalin A-like lectin/glucanase domain-containing protein n=1 Tax=Tuber borchii TaxID=42251 RepID=A0A2T7A8D3_TUBBO|nr:hypothetical protein B9Z19DRAFT_1118532 [Tuber borchii]